MVQADLSASLKIVSDILQTLYLVLDQPEAFLSNYTPNYEVDKFFRDANRLLIFSTQILKPENNEIEIPSDNLFNLLERRQSVYDIGLSSFLILSVGFQILLAYYKKIKGKKAQKPIVRQMQLKRRYEVVEKPFRQVVKNTTFPPAKFETFTNKKIPCYLGESVNSLPAYPYYICRVKLFTIRCFSSSSRFL